MAVVHGKKIKIFSLNSVPALAQEIADYVGVPLSKCKVNRFSDGEVQVNIEETVRIALLNGCKIDSRGNNWFVLSNGTVIELIKSICIIRMLE